MATYTTAAGKRATYKEASSTNNTYVINDDTKGATIAGAVNGDIIAIEGFATDFTASVSGRVITLKSTVDTGIVIKVQLANVTGATASFRFLDGDLTATKGAKITLGTQTLTSKAAAIAETNTLGSNDSSATFDESSGGSSSSTGSTFTLTTGIDSGSAFTGTSGNDTFNAGNPTATAANATFNTVDTLVGGDGTDTLNISGQQTGSTVAASNVSGIEIINVFDTTGVTLSLAGATGVTNVNSKNTTANTNGGAGAHLDLAFTNIGSTSIGLGVDNSAVGASFSFTAAAVAGTADSATLTLNGQTGGTDTVDAGIETLNIVSTGSANTATIAATGATTLNVSGSQTANLGVLATATTTTSTNTAGLTASFTAAGAITVVGGAGNDSFTRAAATADSINGGLGNDTVTFTANLGTTDTLVGGDGTDTLVATSALLSGQTYTNISGFEALTVSNALGGNLTTENIQAGINTVNLAAALADDRTITMGAGSKTIAVNLATAAGANTLTVTDTGSATTDSLTITNGTAAANVFVDADNLAVNGYETVTINTSTTTAAAATQTLGTITVTPDTGGTATINFSGNNSVSTGIITATSAAAGVVNASGLTGTRTFTNVGATVGITSITGSANSDTIVGSATATTIDGGAGNDNITGGAAADSILGGVGNDVIAAGGGNDTISGGVGNDTITQGAAGTTTSIDGGAGNDAIVLTGVLASGQGIGGGDGTDTLTIGTADVTTINGLSFTNANTLNNNITSIERLNIADALAANLDMSRVDGISYVISAANHGGGDTIQGIANASTFEFLTDQTATLTLTMDSATGSSDSITLISTAAAADVTQALGTIAVAGVETVTVQADDADTTDDATATADAAHTLTITDVALRDLNVTGNALSLGLTLTNTAVSVRNINGAAFAGNLTVSNAASTVASTITGGAGADVLTGGTVNDSINGGAGSDTLAGGAGSDILDGGAGTNTLAAYTVGALEGGLVEVTTGTVVNLSADAITNATINAATGDFLTGSATSVAAGKQAWLFNASSALASSDQDTISNITVLNGSDGTDYIAGSASNETIIGGAGIDFIGGGAGADTFILNSVATTNRDVIRDFTTAASGDVLTFDISDFALGGGTVYVGAIAGVAAGSTDEILALTGVGYATDEAAEDAIALQVTTGGLDVVALYFNTTDNTVHVIYDADASVDGTGTVVLVGQLTGTGLDTLAEFATITAANLGSQT